MVEEKWHDLVRFSKHLFHSPQHCRLFLGSLPARPACPALETNDPTCSPHPPLLRTKRGRPAGVLMLDQWWQHAAAAHIDHIDPLPTFAGYQVEVRRLCHGRS